MHLPNKSQKLPISPQPPFNAVMQHSQSKYISQLLKNTKITWKYLKIFKILRITKKILKNTLHAILKYVWSKRLVNNYLIQFVVIFLLAILTLQCRMPSNCSHDRRNDMPISIFPSFPLIITSPSQLIGGRGSLEGWLGSIWGLFSSFSQVVRWSLIRSPYQDQDG